MWKSECWWSCCWYKDNINVNQENVSVNHTDNVNIDANIDVSVDSAPVKNIGSFHLLDIHDPRNWDSLDYRMIDILLENGPKRDLSILKGPKDRFSRRFLRPFILELYRIERSIIGSGLCIPKNLINNFAFVANYLKKGMQEVS